MKKILFILMLAIVSVTSNAETKRPLVGKQSMLWQYTTSFCLSSTNGYYHETSVWQVDMFMQVTLISRTSYWDNTPCEPICQGC